MAACSSSRKTDSGSGSGSDRGSSPASANSANKGRLTVTDKGEKKACSCTQSCSCSKSAFCSNTATTTGISNAHTTTDTKTQAFGHENNGTAFGAQNSHQGPRGNTYALSSAQPPSFSKDSVESFITQVTPTISGPSGVSSAQKQNQDAEALRSDALQVAHILAQRALAGTPGGYSPSMVQSQGFTATPLRSWSRPQDTTPQAPAGVAINHPPYDYVVRKAIAEYLLAWGYTNETGKDSGDFEMTERMMRVDSMTGVALFKDPMHVLSSYAAPIRIKRAVSLIAALPRHPFSCVAVAEAVQKLPDFLEDEIFGNSIEDDITGRDSSTIAVDASGDSGQLESDYTVWYTQSGGSAAQATTYGQKAALSTRPSVRQQNQKSQNEKHEMYKRRAQRAHAITAAAYAALPCASILPTDVPLLPPINGHGKRTLVLDLDETLFHSSFTPGECDVEFTIELATTSTTIYGRMRPYVREFLEAVSEHYEVTVFTASRGIYAKRVLDYIDPWRQYITHELYRESCMFLAETFIKDLSLLGRDLRDTLIIENSPVAYVYQPGNGILVDSWFGNREDTELLRLRDLLVASADYPDLREVARGVSRLYMELEDTCHHLSYTPQGVQNLLELDCAVGVSGALILPPRHSLDFVYAIGHQQQQQQQQHDAELASIRTRPALSDAQYGFARRQHQHQHQQTPQQQEQQATATPIPTAPCMALRDDMPTLISSTSQSTPRIKQSSAASVTPSRMSAPKPMSAPPTTQALGSSSTLKAAIPHLGPMARPAAVSELKAQTLA